MVLGADDDRGSFERVARFVGEFDPAIRTFVVDDRAGWEVDLPPRPTLVFSPAVLRHRPATPVRVCCGYPLAKSEEYRILEHAGIPRQLFTPTFAASRTIGWTAHIVEQVRDNRLIRPTSTYLGPADRKL